jgi:hypothetical protein
MAITKINTPELLDINTTGAKRLPSGPTTGTGGRPTTGLTAGDFRYNTDDDRVEYYDGAAWFQIDDEAIPAVIPVGSEHFNVNTYFGNGATQEIDAKFNEAADFNGSSSIIKTNLNSGSNNLTYSAWINITAAPSQAYGSIVDGRKHFYTFLAIGQNRKVWLSNDQQVSGDTGDSGYATESTTVLSVGVWYHIVGTLSSTDGGKIYINGIEDNTSPNRTANAPAQTATSCIGSRDGGMPFNGKIDQVRIYDSALDQAAVTALQLETTTTASSLSFPSGETAIATYQLDGNGDDISGNYSAISTTDIGYTGLKFTPDFVWIKQRSSPVRNNLLFDTVRGPATNLNILYSDLTNGQDTSVGNGFLSSISTNALNLGSSVYVNGSGEDYVAWCWKAGGTASDITSASSNVSVASRSDNAAAGFSIATYTTNSNSPVVIPHGLDSTPKVALVKNVSSNSDWFWYNTLVSGKGRGFFNQTYAFDNGGVPTLNSTNLTFQAGDPFSSGTSAVVYFFADVTGYQKIGTYTWTNASYTAGTMVTNLGFTPRFVMIKRTNDVGNWQMYDSSRGATSGTQQRYALYADNSDIQNTTDYQSIGFDSDGFSAIVGANGNTTGSGGLNENNGEYLYLAIA